MSLRRQRCPWCTGKEMGPSLGRPGRERQKLCFWSPVELCDARQVAEPLGLRFLFSKMEVKEEQVKGT